MTDWIEFGLFVAAIAADTVAVYAIWAANRNQLLASDRDRRRENYATLLVGLEYLQEEFEQFGTLVRRLSALKPDPAPTGGSVGPEVVQKVLSRLQVWMTGALSGSPMDVSAVTDGMPVGSVPADLPFLLASMNSLLARLSRRAEVMSEAVKLLSLSGTPEEVVNASNELSDWLLGELTKEILDPRKSGDRTEFESKFEALRLLMQKDLGEGTGYEFDEP